MSKHRLTISYRDVEEHTFSASAKQLTQAARDATQLSYAPYSKFAVGAAARLADGAIVKAANLENAAYPQCLCAEATLLSTLHTQYGGKRIEAIAVAVNSPKVRQEAAAPCGSCRQQLFEAERRQQHAIELWLVKPGGGALVFASVTDLLPFGFVL